MRPCEAPSAAGRPRARQPAIAAASISGDLAGLRSTRWIRHHEFDRPTPQDLQRLHRGRDLVTCHADDLSFGTVPGRGTIFCLRLRIHGKPLPARRPPGGMTPRLHARRCLAGAPSSCPGASSWS